MKPLRELGTFQDWCEDLGACVCIVTLIALAWALIYMTAPKQDDQHWRVMIIKGDR